MLSADANAQGRPSRVRLTQEVGSVPTGRITGTLTLMRGGKICVNTTAVMNVSNFDIILLPANPYNYISMCAYHVCAVDVLYILYIGKVLT